VAIGKQIEHVFPEESAIPEKWRIGSPRVQSSFLAGGEIIGWGGPVREVFSPVWRKTSSGPVPRPIGSVPLLTATEAMMALDAAVMAYGNGGGVWPSLSPMERADHVRRLAAGLVDLRERIVKLLMWETAKPLAQAEGEHERTIGYIARSIEMLEEGGPLYGTTLSEGDLRVRISPAPLGVALCLGPYNFPLNETLDLVVPALLMGNTVVLKPPRFGALLYGLLLETLRDSFPPGVVNVIFGSDDILDPLMKSGYVDILGFIGSSRAADELYRLHPRPRLLRSVMGLEAKNPAIVLPDADIDLAVDRCLEGALKFNGQRCTALKILFVHEAVVEEFLRRLVRSVEKLRFGMPWERDVSYTPLPDNERIAYLEALMADAVDRGAGIVNETGGRRHGSFFHPAVLFPVNRDMRIYWEEQFGPIVPVVPFGRDEEPLSHISRSRYSQQVSIFGSRESVGKWVKNLGNQVCRINLNTYCQRSPDTLPFSGRKDSGVGVRSILDTLRAFSTPSVVAESRDGAKGV
jgi:glyceraldehyde-3-phosphate dehydrogenase (NADP+)